MFTKIGSLSLNGGGGLTSLHCFLGLKGWPAATENPWFIVKTLHYVTTDLKLTLVKI